MKTIKISLVLFSFLALCIMSCKKEKLSPQSSGYSASQVNFNSGLGDNPGKPTGTPFLLPKHIKLIGQINGGEELRRTRRNKKAKREHFTIQRTSSSCISVGCGPADVSLYINLYNTLTTATKITFPAGLIFCDSLPSDQDTSIYQKGFLLHSVVIDIPANDTVCINLQLYCLNGNRSPSDLDALYSFGPITNHPDLSKIASIMEKKLCPPDSSKEGIQSVIWNITDPNPEEYLELDPQTGDTLVYFPVGTGKLRPEDITFLNSLE